jgi:hypothetical protein
VFTRLASSETGVDFTNHVAENYTNFFARFQYVYNGGGVAIGDVNADGLPDIYFTANEQANKLFLNQGNMRFRDATEEGAVAGAGGWDNGTVMADVNGDGYLDIYVCRGGPRDNSPEDSRRNLLYLNDGAGRFREAAAEVGLDDAGYSLQAVFFDMDNDNDLDVFVTNRPDTFFIPYPEVLRAKEISDERYRDQLYRNDGGRFVRITEQAGIKGNFGYGLGLTTLDANGDGYTDLYVSNDYLENDYLYENQGDGTFREAIADYTNHVAFYGMGVDVADLDNDGLEDIVQLDMSPEDYVRSKTTMASMNVARYREIMASGFHDQYMHNMLQLNRGGGVFSEVSQLAGISKTDWSWSCLAADYDNDGHRELFVTNGYRRDVADKDANIAFRAYLAGNEPGRHTNEENAAYVISLFNSVPLANYFFDRADTAGLRFENVAALAGFDQPTFSNGAAYGDLDGDGDLDLVVNNLEAEAGIFRNESTEGNYLRIALEGPTGNAFGIGAALSLEFEDGSRQYQIVRTVRGYLSSVEPIAHFGFGEDRQARLLHVDWPDGRHNTLEIPRPNELLTVRHADASATMPAPAPAPKTLFADVTQAHFVTAPRQRENDFDDYHSQVLLPHALSRQGPALAVGDTNGDGREDFYLGGAKGVAGRLYRQQMDGTFTEIPDAFPAGSAIHEDTDALFFDADGDGDLDLYVVSGGSEFPIESPHFQDRLYRNDGMGTFTRDGGSLPKIRSSGGSVTAGDMDGDGDLDLFVGGRIVPTRYPTAPRSQLLRNTGNGFEDVTEALAPGLTDIGMVTDAVWTELDGRPGRDLLIVGEWMPVTAYVQHTNRSFRNETEALGLYATEGWWNTIFPLGEKEDGRGSFALGNLGHNYKFQASAEHPFYVFASDFDANGTSDVFLGKESGDRLVPIRGRECSSQQLPEIADKFPSYAEFAAADLSDIIDVAGERTLKYQVRQFASGSLTPRAAGGYTFTPFPEVAQYSVVNGVIGGDFNADGYADLYLAGNKYEVEIETTRADAGVGTVLLGRADGRWEVAHAKKTGVWLRENVKGLYPIKVGGESYVLVVANGAPLRLLRAGRGANSGGNAFVSPL